MVAEKHHKQTENSDAFKVKFNERLHTVLLSLLTSGVLGCFGFLWNLNATVARLQVHDTEKLKDIEEWSIKTNKIQLDISDIREQIMLDFRDIRERIIRIETKTQKQ